MDESADIQYTPIDKADVGNVVDANLLPVGTHVIINHAVFVVERRDSTNRPIVRCVGTLRGNKDVRQGDTAAVLRNPYPVMFLGSEAVARALLVMENDI